MSPEDRVAFVFITFAALLLAAIVVVCIWSWQ